MKIGLLFDSSSGLTTEQIKGTNIDVIPLHVIFDGEADFLDTPENHQKYETYKAIDGGKRVTTSMASPGEVSEKYDTLLKQYNHIICVTISPNLSGMYQTAVMVANDDEYKGKVTVLKHALAANCLKELAFKFDKMVAKEDIKVEDFQTEIELWEKNTAIIIVPGELDRLAKGGRAKSVLISLLKMLKTKLAIQWGEKPKKVGMGRTITSLLEKIMKTIKNVCGQQFKLMFLHTPETTAKTIDQVKKYLDSAKLNYLEEIVPTPFTCHAGLETIAFIAIKNDIL
ncbi:DegV family protein [Spiroplasma culicicola]|uniref:DegV family protein n=1 Tax=Spiroplasma culicicola AES-1 TaxID=1276246 RepID=W6A8B8_9MOLU|nr:DegV family protein [Spiroplasma culicicola]AHI53237.1 DegV family protein [Spiroplasma culicicola AES-1]